MHLQNGMLEVCNRLVAPVEADVNFRALVVAVLVIREALDKLVREGDGALGNGHIGGIGNHLLLEKIHTVAEQTPAPELLRNLHGPREIPLTPFKLAALAAGADRVAENIARLRREAQHKVADLQRGDIISELEQVHHKVVVDVRAVIHLMLRVGNKADEPAAVAGSSGFLVHQEQCNRLRHRRDEDISVLLIVLVETFGFVTGMGEKSVAALKARCARMLADVPKAECDGREGDWTRAAGASLPQIAASWPVEEREERFLAWMREQAPYLDRPSRSALRIYRNLAVYAWHIAAEEESAPIESDFLPCIRELVSQPEEDERTVAALYENGAISAKKCRAVAGDILLDNLNRSFSDQTDKAKAYHVIAVRPDGQMTVSGGINASRTRVQDLLAGKAEVEKSDMLYLLWFTVGLCWLWNSRPRPSEIYDRLADFIDAAEICLDAAMLPPFYPPHLIEQSMLLSVVYAGRTESDTAEIYEQICSAVIERRKSKNRP